MRTLHVGLRVRDLEQSLAFYRDLGFDVVGEVPETRLGHLTMLKLPGDEFVTIELVSGHTTTPGDNLSHLVVQIDGPPTDEIRTEWRTDPDGNQVELVQWPDGHPDGMTRADFAPHE